MDPVTFQQKWIANTLKERSASQSHFNDLCAVLNQPTPTDADPTGDFYTFERGAAKLGGGDGWADVWYRGHFAWEYKGKRADLAAAYQQLAQYREDLENPPLLIVSDLNRIEIHTNFTDTVKDVHTIDLASFADNANLDKLRRIFTDPASFKPGRTRASVTQDAARSFGQVAIGMHGRGVEPSRAAHYLVQLLFCLFAEDVGLLPNAVFSKMVTQGMRRPAGFRDNATDLLTTMNSGGDVAFEDVPRFNGGLFRTVDAPELTAAEIAILRDAATLDWSAVEPAIFGTLFERSLDPAKRSQLGAHYTGRHDIERVVDPVVMTPLRRRWDAVRAEADALKQRWDEATGPRQRDNRSAAFAARIGRFLNELAAVRILDPACGSGNFLYVALERLLTLEKEVMSYRANNGLPMGLPSIRPTQVLGLEINEYAQELAQVAIWIGYLQWMITNGFTGISEPVLDPLETITLRDALLDHSGGEVSETVWPKADFIIGNPPFIGGNKVRQELGDDYLDTLFTVYDGRVPRFADFVCYFFEKARAQIEGDDTHRAGLLATNSIRGGANREVLKRIKETGDIYLAWSDEPWILDGAAVRISIIGFDDGSEAVRQLNGVPSLTINSDLTAATDITKAHMLGENRGICFMGPSPKGPFDIPEKIAHVMLAQPANVNHRPNNDVVVPVVSAVDIVRRSRSEWTIDFGLLNEEDASQYEMPFEYIRKHVHPIRSKNRRESYRLRWWQYAEARPGLRLASSGLTRKAVTPAVAKHRLFVWQPIEVLCNQGTLVFAREDDYFFGVLHSRAHEVWSLRMGTSLEDRPRYTPTTCFETFPLPWPPGAEPVDDPRVIAIGEAAARLDELRRNWLDPEGASEAELKKRTLTNLYNARPQWLRDVHAALDRAVWNAYGWDDPDPASVEEGTILARLLALNLERAGRT